MQLFWPDDGNWYSVVINAINVKKRMATCAQPVYAADLQFECCITCLRSAFTT